MKASLKELQKQYPGVRFKEIPEYPDYAVNDLGEVFSRRTGSVWKKRKLQNSGGIPSVALCEPNSTRTKKICVRALVEREFPDKCQEPTIEALREQYPDKTIKLVPGFPNYAISEDGCVFSRQPHIFRPWQWRERKPSLINGYYRIGLICPVTMKRRTRGLHSVLLQTFRREPKPGEECRHLNGISWDNRLDNLAWGTPKENTADKRKHDTIGQKLSPASVCLIKVLLALGYSINGLAWYFKVNAKIINGIKNELCWSHVPLSLSLLHTIGRCPSSYKNISKTSKDALPMLINGDVVPVFRPSRY